MKCQLRSKNKQINESVDRWIHVVNCFDMDGTLLLSIVSIHIQHEQPRVQCSTFWNEWELCSLYIWFTDWWNPTQCIEMNHSSNIYLQFHSKTKEKKSIWYFREFISSSVWPIDQFIQFFIVLAHEYEFVVQIDTTCVFLFSFRLKSTSISQVYLNEIACVCMYRYSINDCLL